MQSQACQGMYHKIHDAAMPRCWTHPCIVPQMRGRRRRRRIGLLSGAVMALGQSGIWLVHWPPRIERTAQSSSVSPRATDWPLATASRSMPVTALRGSVCTECTRTSTSYSVRSAFVRTYPFSITLVARASEGRLPGTAFSPAWFIVHAFILALRFMPFHSTSLRVEG